MSESNKVTVSNEEQQVKSSETQPVHLKPINLSPNVLLIGLSTYASQMILPNVQNDVTCMSRRFSEMGVKPMICRDGSKAHVLEMISRFKTNISSTCNVFYYSGHGFTRNGRLQLALKEISDATIDEFSYDVESLSEMMSKVIGGINLIILDCCRDNLKSKNLVAESQWSVPSSVVGCVTIRSCLSDQSSSMTDVSLFTKCLLNNFHGSLDIRGSILRTNVMVKSLFGQQAEYVDNSTLYSIKINPIKGRTSNVIHDSFKTNRVVIFLDPRVVPFWSTNVSWSSHSLPYFEISSNESDLLIKPQCLDDDFIVDHQLWFKVSGGSSLCTTETVLRERGKILREDSPMKKMIEKMPMGELVKYMDIETFPEGVFKTNKDTFFPGVVSSTDGSTKLYCNLDNNDSHSLIEFTVDPRLLSGLGKIFFKVEVLKGTEHYLGWIPVSVMPKDEEDESFDRWTRNRRLRDRISRSSKSDNMDVV